MIAYRYAVQNDALFFHFLQPNIYTSESFTPYEEYVLYTTQSGGGWFSKSMELGYLAMNEALDELEAQGVHNFDLTDILDPSKRKPDTEYYFDFCHVNHLANEVIASHIFDAIAPYLEAQVKNAP